MVAMSFYYKGKIVFIFYANVDQAVMFTRL